MAHSKRYRTQRQPPAPSEVSSRPQDCAEIPKAKVGPIEESRATLETPNLWHAAPRSECWTKARGTEAGSWGSPFAAPERPAQRLRRSPRRRTTLHRSRPSLEAAARFAPCSYEFLTD